jgi:HEAT repeat protein
MGQNNRNRFWRRWLTRWLIARLKTKSVDIRTYLIQALGKIGDESAFPIILHAARDSDNTIRRFAVSALGDFGGKQAIDALIVTLDDPETDIRAAAAIALGRIGDENAENALLAILKDVEASVRAQSIIALGNLGSIKALPVLKEMISTESSEWMHRYISQSIREIERGF